MMFPAEIWEKIFLYTDPVVLTRLKTVCKLWRNIIDKILLENDHWYKKCRKDIPKHLLSSLCTKLDPHRYYTEFHEKQDAIMWMAMYRLWTKCRNLIKYKAREGGENISMHKHAYNSTQCAFQIFFESVVGANAWMLHQNRFLSGTLLASGTSEGYIYIYDMSNLKYPAHKLDHMEYVRNIQFLRNERNTFLIGTSINNHVKFWDITSDVPFKEQRGKLISTSYGYCYTAMNNVIAIEGCIPRRLYELGAVNIVAIEADNDKVFFFTEGGQYGQLCVKECDTECSLVYHAKPPVLEMRGFYIFKPNIAVFITRCGMIGISVTDGWWNIRNAQAIMNGTPTTVLIYANLFIIGLDTGSVHICYVEDFEKWDFDFANSKKIITPERTAVISLDIIIYLEEYLVIAYSKSVWVAKFIC